MKYREVQKNFRGQTEMNMRIEADSIGTLAGPTEAYYGGKSSRANENVASTCTTLHPELDKSLAWIKKAGAVGNA